MVIVFTVSATSLVNAFVTILVTLETIVMFANPMRYHVIIRRVESATMDVETLLHVGAVFTEVATRLINVFATIRTMAFSANFVNPILLRAMENSVTQSTMGAEINFHVATVFMGRAVQETYVCAPLNILETTVKFVSLIPLHVSA